MDINSIKTKVKQHKFITLKQKDNTSPIELILCGPDGKPLSSLSGACTITLLDTVDRQIRESISGNVTSGIVTFTVKNHLKAHPHSIEITVNGKKYPSDGNFIVQVSMSHDEIELNIIDNLTREQAIYDLSTSVVKDTVIKMFSELSSAQQQNAEIVAARGISPNLLQELNRIELKATNASKSLGQFIVNVKQPPYNAKTNGVDDDSIVINQAIKDVNAAGGGIVYCPASTYTINSPVVMNSKVTLLGAGVKSTIFSKKSTNLYNTINSVIYAKGIESFKIIAIQLNGDRKTYAENNTVTTEGMYIENCSYFNIENVNSTNVSYGFRFNTCWVVYLKRLTATTTQKYGFHAFSCTSLNFDNPACWGTGGAYYFENTVYTTLSSPVCDHNCAGGRSDDPFLPQGSGGNYLSPEPVFKFITSTITVNAPGTEKGYSQYIYCDGSNIEVNTPYVWRNYNYSTTSKFIEVKGATASNLVINSPNFTEVVNYATVGNGVWGIYVEAPRLQKVKLNKFIKISDTYGANEYTKDGIEYTFSNKVHDYNKFNMMLGATTQISIQASAAAGKVEVIDSSGAKLINFVNNVAQEVYYRVPVPNFGTLRIKIKGNFTSSYNPLLVRVLRADGGLIKTLPSTTSGTAINIDEYLSPGTTSDIFIQFRSSYSSDVIQLSEFTIEQIV